MAKHLISLVKDFDECPGGRYKFEGDFSGEEFRKKILEPALEQHGEIIIDLNGASALAPSFLDESIGMLAKKFGRTEFEKKVHFILEDDNTALRKLNESIERRSKQWSPKSS